MRFNYIIINYIAEQVFKFFQIINALQYELILLSRFMNIYLFCFR